MRLVAALMYGLLSSASAFALDLPPLKPSLNDLAGMFPQASVDELEHRLHRFHTETAQTVVVLTLKTLDGESIDAVARQAFDKLPLQSPELDNTVLLVVARKEREVGLRTGAALEPLLPEPLASRNLTAQVALYWDGLRPDLGVHGAVHYLFRVIRGDARVGQLSEEEKLEQISLSGGEAGAIFALVLSPFLALFIGALWGIYATQYGVQRGPRLLMGAIFGGGSAKIVAMFMSLLGNYGDTLWYFIMVLAIPLGVFGSLTEFWMSGDWSGIPRFKGRKRRPEDNMGI